jgi:hypothetical protein
MVLPHIVEVQMTFTPIGSQTDGVNRLSQKYHGFSNIAQAADNEPYTPRYITGDPIASYTVSPNPPPQPVSSLNPNQFDDDLIRQPFMESIL